MHIGLDLGGTKIEGLALSKDGHELERKRINTPQGNYTAILMSLKLLAESLEHRHGPAQSIGICTPGSLAVDTGLMQNSNSTCLNGQSFLDDLQEKLGRPVAMANDADCLALSEATDGAAKDAQTVFSVILGTGVGGGLVVNKQLISGPNRLTGEWGHTSLPVKNREPNCYCGKSSCVETQLSGPALTQRFLEITGMRMPVEEIVKYDSPLARQLLDEWHDDLARAIGNIINTLDPDCIVFGGGLSNISSIYSELPKRVLPHIMSTYCYTQFVPAVHGDSSGVRGAARLRLSV